MPKNNQGSRGNRGQNNNPEGRNQYSGGVMEIARERPMAAAIGAAAAVGAGVFLWSRRNQISDQISNLSEQIGEWTQNMSSASSGGSDMEMSDDTAGLASTGSTGGTQGSPSRRGRGGATAGVGMSETGGGNASLGAQTGGGGMATSPSGRGRAQPR